MEDIPYDNLGRERELERRQRRLERECQLGDESEQVESGQSGCFSKISSFKNLFTGFLFVFASRRASVRFRQDGEIKRYIFYCREFSFPTLLGAKTSEYRMRQMLYSDILIYYADDFVVLSDSKDWLIKQIEPVKSFLSDRLKLELHPDKIFIKTLASGVDFLGWIHFPNHRILRTATKRRMFKRLQKSLTPETLNSYLGLIKHGNTEKIRKKIYLIQKV